MGEDLTLTGDGLPGLGSPAGAKVELARLEADKDHMAALMNKSDPGHKAAVQKRNELQKIASGGDAKA